MLRLSFLAIFLIGCNGTQSPSVHGTITLNGQPIEQSTIQIMPQGEGQPVGDHFQQGKFALKNAPLGKVKVTILARKDTGKMYDDNGTQRAETVSIIPPAYEAGIDREIKPGDNQLDFELKSSP